MTGGELMDLLDQSHRRPHLTGTHENGVIAALDMEGRFFTVVNNRVINRVVPSAIKNRSNKDAFQNPGGDTLWPAPEGTRLGYEYATGAWRVPPSVTGAVWEVVFNSGCQTAIRAEIDLINNMQVGIPCEFERQIEIESKGSCFIQNVTETIRYIGKKTLTQKEFSLAPWSLCQFDSGKTGKAIIPALAKEDIWDMYGPSGPHQQLANGWFIVETETDERFQLGLNPKVLWVEYTLEERFRIKRFSGELPDGQIHIDISDSSPDMLPSNRGVGLSIYCDPSGFVEMEACGGCPGILNTGTELSVKVTTEFNKL